MGVDSFVSVVGSFASLIGLSIQVFEKCQKKLGSEQQADRVALFVSLTDITRTWKKIHNDYHRLDQDIRLMSAKLSNGTGGLKAARDLSDADMTSIIRSCPQLSAEAQKFRGNLETYFREPRRIISSTEKDIDIAVADIRAALGLQISQCAGSMHQSQRNAIIAHEYVCTFMDTLTPLVRNTSWNNDSKQIFLDGFERFPDDWANVVRDCDVILLNTIELYENISSDLI